MRSHTIFKQKTLLIAGMEATEKQDIKLRFGLALKTIMEENKAKAAEQKNNGQRDRNLVSSFPKLEIASGVPKATLIEIVHGRRNAASTTLALIVEALGKTMAEFGQYYDRITTAQVIHYKSALAGGKEQRATRRGKRS